jgi:hypothetical protein
MPPPHIHEKVAELEEVERENNRPMGTSHLKLEAP